MYIYICVYFQWISGNFLRLKKIIQRVYHLKGTKNHLGVHCRKSSPLAAWRPGFSVLVLRLLCAKNCGSDQGCFLTGTVPASSTLQSQVPTWPYPATVPGGSLNFNGRPLLKLNQSMQDSRFVNPNMLVPWNASETQVFCVTSLFFESVSLRSGEKKRSILEMKKKLMSN